MFTDPNTGAVQNIVPNTGVSNPRYDGASSRTDDYHCFTTADRFSFAEYNMVLTPSGAKACSVSSASTSPTTCSGTSRHWATVVSRPTRPARAAVLRPRWRHRQSAGRQHRGLRLNRTTRSASIWFPATT
jgi:hypothetical protein